MAGRLSRRLQAWEMVMRMAKAAFLGWGDVVVASLMAFTIALLSQWIVTRVVGGV